MGDANQVSGARYRQQYLQDGNSPTWVGSHQALLRFWHSVLHA